MNCFLMHQNIKVAESEVSESGSISKVGEVFSLERPPIETTGRDGQADTSSLDRWRKRRSITASRSGGRN